MMPDVCSVRLATSPRAAATAVFPETLETSPSAEKFTPCAEDPVVAVTTSEDDCAIVVEACTVIGPASATAAAALLAIAADEARLPDTVAVARPSASIETAATVAATLPASADCCKKPKFAIPDMLLPTACADIWLPRMEA